MKKCDFRFFTTVPLKLGRDNGHDPIYAKLRQLINLIWKQTGDTSFRIFSSSFSVNFNVLQVSICSIQALRHIMKLLLEIFILDFLSWKQNLKQFS